MVREGDMVSFALGYGRNEASRRDEGGGRKQCRTMVRVDMQGKVLQWFIIFLWEWISC